MQVQILLDNVVWGVVLVDSPRIRVIGELAAGEVDVHALARLLLPTLIAVVLEPCHHVLVCVFFEKVRVLTARHHFSLTGVVIVLLCGQRVVFCPAFVLE